MAGNPGGPRATFTGWGKCVPPVKLTNADLEQLVNTDNDWIVERTGIHERGISHVETTDLAEVAARRALAAAGLEPTDIDMLILATVTPEITCPSNACVLQERLEAVNAAAFDLNAACSGWIYGTATASSMITGGVAERVLLVGAEKLHWVMDYWDRATCILFGDGAGAAVLEPSESGDGVLSTDLGADGVAGRTMVFPTLGTRGRLSNVRDPFMHRLHFDGRAVFKIAVQGIEKSVRRAVDRAGLELGGGRCGDPPPGQRADHLGRSPAPGGRPRPGDAQHRHPRQLRGGVGADGSVRRPRRRADPAGLHRGADRVRRRRHLGVHSDALGRAGGAPRPLRSRAASLRRNRLRPAGLQPRLLRAARHGP